MILADQCNYMKRELRKTSNKSTGHRCDRKLLSRKWDPWGTDRWSFEVLAHYQVGQPSLHLLKYLYISVFLKARKALKRGPAWIPDDSIHWTPFIFPSHTSHRHEHLGMPTQPNSYPKNLPILSPATVWKWNKNCSFNGIFRYSTTLLISPSMNRLQQSNKNCKGLWVLLDGSLWPITAVDVVKLHEQHRTEEPKPSWRLCPCGRISSPQAGKEWDGRQVTGFSGVIMKIPVMKNLEWFEGESNLVKQHWKWLQSGGFAMTHDLQVPTQPKKHVQNVALIASWRTQQGWMDMFHLLQHPGFRVRMTFVSVLAGGCVSKKWPQKAMT